MPDVDSTLRTPCQWLLILKTNLTKALYKITLARDSLRYCSIITPFRGIHVYTRCAMGMPGSDAGIAHVLSNSRLPSAVLCP